MDFLLLSWLSLCLFFLGTPAIYYLYMKKRSFAEWNLDILKGYLPSVAILVPVHNEEKTIQLKLENLQRVSYPPNKIQTIIANDASTDNTMKELSDYIKLKPSHKITVFDSTEHLGKTACLNRALKDLESEVVVISDADCFWPSDILLKAVPYLSDPAVGAVTARELLLNPQDSWVTLGEQFYNNTVQSIRIGESKLHSTLFFQGGFAAYKRSMIDGFNDSTDDSGTALDIIQKNKRTILIPEIGFFTAGPTIWRNKVSIKIRRASQLQQLWAKCLNLLLHRKLAIPKRIAVPEIILHLLNPILLVAILILSTYVIVQYPISMLTLILVVSPLFLFKRTRNTAFEALQNNLILLFALTSFLSRRKFKLWNTVQESRLQLNKTVLQEKKLI